MNNLSDYTRRMDALRDQLIDALRPETDHERSLIQWLRDSLSTDGLAAMVEMVERAVGESFQPAPPSSLERDWQVGDERRGQ